MIRTKQGRFGEKLLESGAVLELSEKREDQLVRRGVAEYCKKEVPLFFKPIYKTEAELKRLRTKKELIAYGKEIGLVLSEEDTKETLIQAILKEMGGENK